MGKILAELKGHTYRLNREKKYSRTMQFFFGYTSIHNMDKNRSFQTLKKEGGGIRLF